MRHQHGRKPATGRTGPAHQHQIRIIGGQWKRTPLPVPDAEGLRPTPDRVRETVFNWLQHLLDGAWSRAACLDLFAGTGVLGFEAASRGAARVVMVESGVPAVRQLEATRQKLHADQVDILRGDALVIAQRLAADDARFDVIFLDPPYHQDWLARMLPSCKRLLAENGLVYAEAETPLAYDNTPDWLAGWEVIRADRAGMVFYHLLQCKSQPDFQA
ncbi:MAG TPA: 16S rRNA (guanine(966)-N(2))-methyltransferase RsmD [Paucimonas sp.]|nr:16S rRNA (guanine(966)-N(2))-methyltransferase RsmD [Paucimonas sp.]HJW53863.1 16S rRNA (guanine(966)-N(2))-methyltransferase RsmD [Burkholderiaceae bacterium]